MYLSKGAGLGASSVRTALPILLFVVVGFGSSLAADLHVVSVTATTTANGMAVNIRCSSEITAFQRAEQSGRTIIVRLPNALLDSGAVDSTLSSNGLQFSSERIRTMLVLRFILPGAPDNVQLKRDGPKALLLDIGHKPPTAGVQKQTNASTKWLLDVIVIDAGHGGIDAGAIGVNQVSEKAVTLSIAKKVKALINDAMPNTRVVMTRETDSFVELFKRTQIANEARGKLFVSIHCNSMPTKPHPARGCETYILRPGRNADAARVAARENASIQYERSTNRYNSMNEEQLIVATMAQRSFVRFSEELARAVQKSVHENTSLADRGVNQAGFYVLVGASMPNILFETAFLSNTEDAAYISSATGQQETALAIVKAILSYAEIYQRSTTH